MGCRGSKLEKDIENYPNFEKIKPIMTVYPPSPKKVLKVDLKNGRHSFRQKSSTNISSSKLKTSKSSNSKRHLSESTVKKKRHVPKNLIYKNYDRKILAKYDIKGLIGKGSYSKVFRVEHKQSKQPFGIKIIDKTEGFETFESELGILTRVNHPNVIKLKEVFETEKHIYMVMELATGGNLLDRLKEVGIFSEEEAKRTLKMVINGINYLHNLGITHRDLKPDNILYYHPGKESRLMITDFGIASARKHSGNPYMYTICGTPQYLAPEIILRRPYTCAVDMWAIGVIMYILLKGTFPFDATQDAQIFKLILHHNISCTTKALAPHQYRGNFHFLTSSMGRRSSLCQLHEILNSMCQGHQHAINLREIRRSRVSQIELRCNQLVRFIASPDVRRLEVFVQHGEAASSDMKAAEDYIKTFSDLIKAQGYISQQVFNCDETGLFWKKMPNRTYITAEKMMPGHKPMKDRLTLALCANASGDCKIKPLLVYHSENPRAFKSHKILKEKLQVMWRSNPKAKTSEDI
ncbi:PSKH1 [Cordylochernes scorpioides]|uniref:PSKH1 n=1 Tax=Cordylochernes scorpioides TaxID=51811 RepID=A0ABY6LLU7_9ARAC|nr:PSKH1 [Cordylochernes scorpioides]